MLTLHGTEGFLVRQLAKRELYLEHADSASLILMGDHFAQKAFPGRAFLLLPFALA